MPNRDQPSHSEVDPNAELELQYQKRDQMRDDNDKIERSTTDLLNRRDALRDVGKEERDNLSSVNDEIATVTQDSNLEPADRVNRLINLEQDRKVALLRHHEVVEREAEKLLKENE